MAANLTHQSSLRSTPMEVTSMLLERPLEQRDTHSSVTGYCRACSRTMPRCQSLEECRAIAYRRDLRPAAPSSAALIATTTHMRGINRLCVAVKCRLNEHFTRCCRAVDRMPTSSDDALRSTYSLASRASPLQTPHAQKQQYFARNRSLFAMRSPAHLAATTRGNLFMQSSGTRTAKRWV